MNIAVKKATPEETAEALVSKYDDLVARHSFAKPHHHKWGEMASVAALLADFVADQYKVCAKPPQAK